MNQTRKSKTIITISAILVIATCVGILFLSVPGQGKSASREGSPEDSGISATSNWQEQWFQLGKDTFNAVCIDCHGEGKSAAPQIGDRDSWKDRSPLWSAVLIEHAKKGYMEMPPKGGAPVLSDREVEAAGEYMLSVTFPELPRD